MEPRHGQDDDNRDHHQNRDHHDHHEHAGHDRSSGRRGPGGGRRRGPGGRGPDGPPFGPPFDVPRRGRARRGAVGQAVLALLAERPMHGYELITALDQRTEGAWKPSPGSMYPTLGRLEHKGLIEAVADQADSDTRQYQLTDAGRQRVAEMVDAGVTEPWNQLAESAGSGLRRAMAELSGPMRQIGRFGTPDQIEAAQKAVAGATAQLYRILADGATSGSDSD